MGCAPLTRGGGVGGCNATAVVPPVLPRVGNVAPSVRLFPAGVWFTTHLEELGDEGSAKTANGGTADHRAGRATSHLAGHGTSAGTEKVGTEATLILRTGVGGRAGSLVLAGLLGGLHNLGGVDLLGVRLAGRSVGVVPGRGGRVGRGVDLEWSAITSHVACTAISDGGKCGWQLTVEPSVVAVEHRSATKDHGLQHLRARHALVVPLADPETC